MLVFQKILHVHEMIDFQKKIFVDDVQRVSFGMY